MALALEGIRIVDLTWLGPGNFCSIMLGDLGADVIEVYEAHPERRGAPYTMLFDPSRPGLRNCRTIGIDLKSPAGRDVLYDLVKTADVVMEGFRPGVIKRLGADYDTVKQINPRIVYASLTGYGQSGPYRDLVGHDINYIAMGGLLGLNGPAGGAPVIPGTVLADFTAGGMSAAIGILASLLGRERTGARQEPVATGKGRGQGRVHGLARALEGGGQSQNGSDGVAVRVEVPDDQEATIAVQDLAQRRRDCPHLRRHRFRLQSSPRPPLQHRSPRGAHRGAGP